MMTDLPNQMLVISPISPDSLSILTKQKKATKTIRRRVSSQIRTMKDKQNKTKSMKDLEKEITINSNITQQQRMIKHHKALC
eukprot:3151026-Ditylum_brightwellii.AAC.1